MKKIIGIHEPTFQGNEKKYVLNCIKDGWVSTSGKFLNLFTKKLQKITKSKYVLPVLNGTIGLHLSLILSDVGKDDEVILPTVTFVASANAIRYLDASPIFMDTDQYLNIDQQKTIQFIELNTKKIGKYTINKKTKKRIKALIVVHTFGSAAKFEELYKLCKQRNIKIIEDAAESLGTIYKKNKFKNKHTGTIGDFGVVSFNGNKIVTSGNGGALLIQNKKYYYRANYLVNQSKNDGLNFIHNEIGYNYKLSNVSAALGLAQLEKLNFFIEKKKKVRGYYKSITKNMKGINVLKSPPYSKNNYWLNLLEIDPKIIKVKISTLIKELNREGVQLRPVWHLNHLQKHLKNFENYKISRSRNIVKNIICLPSSSFLKKNDISKIIKKIYSFNK